MKLSSLVRHLEERGSMYVQPYNYNTIVAYLSGYDNAIIDSGGVSELDAFRIWLNQHVGHHCSMHWSVVIKDVLANGDEDLARKKLFEMFHDFDGTQ